MCPLGRSMDQKMSNCLPQTSTIFVICKKPKKIFGKIKSKCCAMTILNAY